MVRGLSTLVNLEAYAKKYSVPVPEKTDVLLYAMGDGNHSFATAKLHWERTKEKAEVTLPPCKGAQRGRMGGHGLYNSFVCFVE